MILFHCDQYKKKEQHLEIKIWSPTYGWGQVPNSEKPLWPEFFLKQNNFIIFVNINSNVTNWMLGVFWPNSKIVTVTSISLAFNFFSLTSELCHLKYFMQSKINIKKNLSPTLSVGDLYMAQQWTISLWQNPLALYKVLLCQ